MVSISTINSSDKAKATERDAYCRLNKQRPHRFLNKLDAKALGNEHYLRQQCHFSKRYFTP